MRIRRVYFDKVGPLAQHSGALIFDDITRGSVCLRGLNGAGKSTWLRAAHKLWVWFRRSATRRKPVPLIATDPGGLPGACAGMLVDDLPGPLTRLWLWQGSAEAWLAEAQLPGELDVPVLMSDAAFFGSAASVSRAHLQSWDESFARAEQGLAPLPNITLIGAEQRTATPPRAAELMAPGRSPAWVAAPHYVPGAGMDNLEVVMRGLALARKPDWALLRGLVPKLLRGLSLLDDFDESSQRPRFQLASGQLLTLDQLSAGERALLITLVTVLRFSSPGGIVLLDEPELHQHLSLMRGSLAAIERLVVAERQGQLIVASHAPEVWDRYQGGGTLIDLRADR